ERPTAVPVEDDLKDLDADLVRLRQEAGEWPLHPPAGGDRGRRLPLDDIQGIGHVAADLGRRVRRQDCEREADSLRHPPAQLDGPDAETRPLDEVSSFDDLRLEAGRPEELELGADRQEGVDLAVDDAVADPEFPLLDDDPPTEDPSHLNGI